MKTTRSVFVIAAAAIFVISARCRSTEVNLPGIELARPPLRIRVVDNSARYFHLSDTVVTGMNGLASLIHEGQNKNILAYCGMNLEETKTNPPYGALEKLWNAPRVAPMRIERVDPCSVKLTQAAAEAAGLNHEIIFTLGESCVDQTIVTWPDQNIESSHAFYATYMNQPQNTSLFLHGVLQDNGKSQWMELTSPGHGGDGAVFFRPIEPEGKVWHEFLTDNPVKRQGRFRSVQTIAAAEKAGFKAGAIKGFDNFMFGLFDEYVLLFIFAPRADTRFGMWISSSGALAVRCPAWDYIIDSGAQKAGERRTFNVRLVYKPFIDVNDVLAEVKRFNEEVSTQKRAEQRRTDLRPERFVSQAADMRH